MKNEELYKSKTVKESGSIFSPSLFESVKKYP